MAKKLIEIKNDAVHFFNMNENGVEYKFIENIINNEFNNKIIIPVVLDKHKIFIKLKDDKDKNDSNDNIIEENFNNNLYFSNSLENTEGIIEENQKTQFATLKSLYHEYALNNIDFKSFINSVNDISRPYLPKYDEDKLGYIKKLKNNSLVLRYYDVDTIHWNTYNIQNDYLYSKDVFDEVTGKIKGLKNDILLRGDEVNIIGFMILNKNNLLNNKSFKKRGNITKIFTSGDALIVECIKHGLNGSDTIFIDESNSYPFINHIFSKSFKIIDENNIEISQNIKLIKNGNSGVLYSLDKLVYDLYNIVKKEDNTIDIIKNSSTNNNVNKIYLFDKLNNLDKNDYNNIIKKIIPTRNEIIKSEMHNLKKSYTFDDVKNIINKYKLSFNELNIEQIAIIKNIFKHNLNKLLSIKEKPLIKLNFNKNIKKNFTNEKFFLSNKFITNPEIEEIYGPYKYLDKPEDNVLLRLKWVQSQKDNGELYYLYYILSIKKSEKFNSKFISSKLEELNKLYKELDKNFKKEENTSSKNKYRNYKLYKYQAYIISEQDAIGGFSNLKKILENGTVVFYKDNLYLWQGKLVQFENLEENTIAVVGNELWIWQKGTWSKSNAFPHYENIKHLCEFNNINLENIKLDSLDCIYRKDYGCNSKIYLRLHEKLNKTKEDLENFMKLEEYIKDDKIINNIKSKIEYLKFKFYPSIKLTNVKLTNVKLTNVKLNQIKKINDNLTVLTNLIYSIKNQDERLNYIYELIDKDGLLIDNHIYSKKYKKKIDICSHYYYFKQINYANNPDYKVKLIDEMITIYSDNGEHELNSHTCKVCGEFLAINEYDDTEGFSETGMIKRSRETWVLEKVKDDKVVNTDLSLYIEDIKLDDSFKEVLMKHGLSHDDTDEAISIATFIIKNLYNKAGVIVPNIDLINIIMDSMQKIKSIKSFSIYQITEIKKLQEKGFSKFNIEKQIEKGTFKTGYERYYKLRRYSIILARYLIAIQVAIPSLIRSSKTTICPFYSFNGDEGIAYMTCILDEMDFIMLRDKTKAFEIFKAGITDAYNEFKVLKYIREQFKAKSAYELELSKKTDLFKFFNENKGNNDIIKEYNKLSNNYDKLLKDKSSNILIMKDMHNQLINRLKYLSYIIKQIINNFISSSIITNTFGSHIESSCCTEDAINFTDYYYLIQLESNYPIKTYINESKYIYDYVKYFINIGSIHKFLLYDKDKYSGIYNNAIVDDETNTSQNVIKAVFEVFVDTGVNAGTLREYIGNIDNLIDIKSGLTKKEIIEKEYTIDEYQKLLRNIEKHNIKYNVSENKIIFTKAELDNIKKKSYDKLNIEINTLIKNVSNILNKDKDFIQKYTDILRNFGLFDDYDKYETDSEISIKEKIKYRDSLNKMKTDYMKKFYITKIKKYLSTIKNFKINNSNNNDINLSFIGDDSIELELQSIIYNNNKKLLKFKNEEIRKYFDDLKILYTNEQINSIHGIDNIYDLNYDKIKVYSDFNFNDSSNVLLYIIVTQLNSFITCAIDYVDKSENNNLNGSHIHSKNVKTIKCKHFCDFIMVLFEELEEDIELFTNCSKSSENIKNSLIHDIIEYKKKQYIHEDVDYVDIMIQQKLGKKSYAIDDLDEKIDNEELDFNEEQKYQDKIDMIMEKGKKELSKKLGYSPSDDQLETYKDNYLKSMQDDMMYEEEAYDLASAPKGDNVLDQGASYGEINEFDFETGDGFDYSDQMD